jgi:hypothetical protein
LNPWEQVTLVLTESKREGLPWDDAWFKAMRTLSPEKTTGYGPLVRKGLEEERDLLRECRPWLQAAYEDREVTVAEFERASVEAEKRLDSIMQPA